MTYENNKENPHLIRIPKAKKVKREVPDKKRYDHTFGLKPVWIPGYSLYKRTSNIIKHV